MFGQMDLTNVFRSCQPKTTEYTLFSSAYEAFSRLHTISQKKYQQIFEKSKTYYPSFMTIWYGMRSQSQEKIWTAHKYKEDRYHGTE